MTRFLFEIDQETWLEIGISAAILILFLGFRKVFTTYIFKFFLKLAQRHQINTAAKLMIALEKPFRWLIVLIGFIIAMKYFPYDPIPEQTLSRLFRSIFLIIASWALVNVSSILTLLFPKLINKLDLGVDQIIIPFFTKILKIIIAALAISMIAEVWGFNVNGFVAGLGLGGLAFALAAKDTISNLFGGIVIIMEKPFTIGEWIKTPSVEGTVEDITFRSTKVRTFAQALVTVPNATLSNEPIINWSKMGKRQVAFHLRISYRTSGQQMKTIIARIEKVLHDHPGVHPETIMVNFDQFSQSSMDIYLYFFTSTTVWAEFLQIKQDVNLKIMDILEEEDVEIALPVQTLILDKAPDFQIDTEH